MNILFVCEYDWLKSVVFDIHVLAEGLSLQGHKVYVIDYGRNQGSGIRFRTIELSNSPRVFDKAIVVLKRPGYIRIRAKRPSFLKLFLLEYLSLCITHYLEIRKTIQREKIDAVVLYSVATNGYSACRLAKKYQIPVIFRNVDMLHKLNSNKVDRFLIKSFEKSVYPRVDSLLALTPNYAKYLVSLGAQESRIKLLLFPIDTTLFQPDVDSTKVRKDWNINQDDKVILFVGTLYPFGGFDKFIRIFSTVLSRIPSAKLMLVGDGPKRTELESIIRALGFEQKVIITGYQPFQTLPQFINLATVCLNVLTDVDITRDLFSAKVIQYLACGKATVCSSFPGMKSVLPGKSHGVVYAESINEIAEQLVDLIESKEKRERIGRAGFNYVRQSHSFETIINQFEQHLQGVVKTKKVMLSHG